MTRAERDAARERIGESGGVRGPIDARRATRRERWAPWVEGAVLALVVLAILALGGDAVRASYHGYLHATLGEAVLRDGLVPENPYHAGTPLRYYTLYPALGVAIGRIGIGPMWGFAALNVLAALLLAPSLDALGRACKLAFVARRAAFLAAVLGFNALGWTGLHGEWWSAFGDARAAEPPVFRTMPMCFAEHAWGWDARLQAFLPKFLNVSSFAIALPFALWTLAAAFDARSRRATWSAGASVGLATALNPLVGGLAALVAGVAVLPSLVRDARARRARFDWLVAGAVAAAIAIPFLLPALAAAPEGPSLVGVPDLGGSPVANAIGPLVVVLPLGIAGLFELERRARRRLLVALALCAALVLVGEMPQGNEYKMERLGGLLWALPAGAFVAAWIARARSARARLGRALAALVLALLALPTTVAVVHAYLDYGKSAPALPLAPDDRGRMRPPSSEREAPPAELFERESALDPRAVVVMEHTEGGARLGASLVQGNGLAPALAHPLFVDLPQIHNDRQPDLERRLDLVAALFEGLRFRPRRGDALAAKDALAEIRATLRDRPWIVFLDDGDELAIPTIRAAGGREVARAGRTSLWELDALGPASPEPR